MKLARPEAGPSAAPPRTSSATHQIRLAGAPDAPPTPAAAPEPAWTAIAENAALLSAAAAGTLVCGLWSSDFGPWPLAWALCGIALVLAWQAGADGRRPHRVSAVGLLLLAWPLALPALPESAGLPALHGRLGAAALVACCGAHVFAPRPELGITAIALLPLQLLGREAPGAEALLLSALAAALACCLFVGQSRAWQRRQRLQAALEQRLADAEHQCRAAERADAEKTRFLSATSHDLRQPVHALGMFAATLDKRLRGTRDEPLVRNVVRSIEGLDRSLNAMLDVSRLDAGIVQPSFQHFPLRDLFRRLHMQFAGQAELAGLALRFSPGGKWVSSDPQLLERILGNLIQNAVKYTAHGGVVVVARSTRTHIHVEVWDSGVGIAPSQLPRIFDEYYQVPGHRALRQQGMGMGLAIVRRLVDLLGHRLSVVSRPGRGTMFRLAIAQGGAPELQDLTAPADTQPMPAGHLRTILIVEDDDAVREGLALLLEESGYAAVQAASLEEALQKLRVLELPPDLLLTDLRLGPDEATPGGLQVIEELRRECGFELPAIVITGDTVTDEVKQLADGAHPVLFKPVDPRKLLLRIRSLVA